MSLRLHTIKAAKSTTKKRKRVGRGNASGHGTYSGRGQKGQRSRSGGRKGLKRLGMKHILLNIPKKRGFKSKKPKNQVINLIQINKCYKEGETVNPKSLMKKELIDTIKLSTKILGTGELKVKNLQFDDVKISESVKKQIDKMKGKIVNLEVRSKK